MDNRIRIVQDFNGNFNTEKVVVNDCNPRMYNGKQQGWKYTCSNNRELQATHKLKQLIEESGIGYGEEFDLSKTSETNAKGETFTNFTVNGKTLNDLKGGNAPTTTTNSAPQQNGQVTQAPQSTTTMPDLSSLEQRVMALEKQVADLNSKTLF